MMYYSNLFTRGKDTIDYFAHYFSSVHENQVTSTTNTHLTIKIQ